MSISEMEATSMRMGWTLRGAGCPTAGALEASQAANKDARYWQQLTALLKPVDLKSMTDHRAFMTPDGMVVALHFDNMDLSKAENLNWVAIGVSGKFTRAEQQRVEQQFEKGFTHFHDVKNDVHGGQPGGDGVWFKHIAVRDFESPMSGGRVTAGVDEKFHAHSANAITGRGVAVARRRLPVVLG